MEQGNGCYSLRQLWMQKRQQWISLLHNDSDGLDGIHVYPFHLVTVSFITRITKSHSIPYLACQFFYWMNIRCSILFGIGMLWSCIWKGDMIGFFGIYHHLWRFKWKGRRTWCNVTTGSRQKRHSLPNFSFGDTWFHHSHDVSSPPWSILLCTFPFYAAIVFHIGFSIIAMKWDDVFIVIIWVPSMIA